MPYASQQDMIDRFGESEMIQLTRGDTAIDAAVLEEAQAQADSEIDGYLRGRYALPLADVPELIKRCACDIVRWILFIGSIPEEVERRYKRAIELLQGVAKGEIVLNLPASPGEGETTNVGLPRFVSLDVDNWREL